MEQKTPSLKETIKIEKQVAQSYGGLSLSLFALAILLDVKWEFYFVIGLGVFSALISAFIYLALYYRWGRNRTINKFLAKVVPLYISHLIWLVGFGALGISIQSKGHVIW
jgi:hypothetical protein